jgi:hypothetical protein
MWEVRGAAMLIASHVLLAVVLLALQSGIASAVDRLLVLILINLIVGILAGLATWRHLSRVLGSYWVTLILWSLGYSAAFGAFLVFPAQLPLGLFMIASALSPALAVWIYSVSAKHVSEGLSFVPLLPMLLLIVLALIEAPLSASWLVAPLFLFVLLAQVAIQYGLRRTARESNPICVSALLSLLNVICLPCLIFAARSTVSPIQPRELLYAVASAPCVLLLQLLRLSGLRVTSLAAGAVAMSTAVPISLVVEEIHLGRYHPLSLTISGIYVLSALQMRTSLHRVSETRTSQTNDRSLRP